MGKIWKYNFSFHFHIDSPAKKLNHETDIITKHFNYSIINISPQYVTFISHIISLYFFGLKRICFFLIWFGISIKLFIIHSSPVTILELYLGKKRKNLKKSTCNFFYQFLPIQISKNQLSSLSTFYLHWN